MIRTSHPIVPRSRQRVHSSRDVCHDPPVSTPVISLTRTRRGARRSRLGLACAALLTVACLFVGYRFLSTFSKYDVLWWGPTATPPKFQFDQHEYNRGSVKFRYERVRELPAYLRLTDHGKSPTGPTMFTTDGYAPPVIYLKNGSTYVGYGCLCGGS